MDIVSISMANAQVGGLQPVPKGDGEGAKTGGSDKPAEASRQFEAILVRQFIDESMKSLTESGGSGGQVYGYFITNTLADAMTKGSGIGLSNILQAQLKK